MSNHMNYNKMFDANEKNPVTEVEETETEVVEQEVEETCTAMPEPVEEPKIVMATVIDCVKLNMREHPSTDADVLCIIPVGTEVQVDVDNYYADWFRVYTAAGQEGFCMKQFICVK